MKERQRSESAQKQIVALTSVMAAFFITTLKLVIGIMTGSLGLLSEALHSGLDLVASLITWFSVRISDKPPDRNHHYGHGKVENLSALIETILLLVTCTWIIYEAIHRLRSSEVHIEVSGWGFAVIILSMAVDWTRSRALHKAAKKFNSQALEADALHFSTDIWSSAVVLFGLLGAKLGYYEADIVAALVVAGIVIIVSLRLGMRTIDALLDREPNGIKEKVESAMQTVHGLDCFHDLRIRSSGADVWIEMNVHVESTMSVANAHRIADIIEATLKAEIPRCNVLVHIEPSWGH